MTMLAHLVAPLNVVLFTLGNFPIGIANSAFFLVLFMTARLYADSGLQVIYIGGGPAQPAAGSLEDRLTLATRVTDYVLDNRSRFGPAITDGVAAR